MTGYLTNRFTAEMHIRVPQGMRVLASGSQGNPTEVTLADGKPGDQFNFNWTKPGFPGTVIAGRFVAPVSPSGAANIHVYLSVSHQQSRNELAETAAKEVDFFTDLWRAGVWAAECGGAAGRHAAGGVGSGAGGDYGIANRGQVGIRLLANTIAHQWWGSEVSPQTMNDAWITNGMSRYGELMYLEDENGQVGAEDRHAGYFGERAGLRYDSAVERGATERVFAAVPIDDAGQGRDGLSHASLGSWRRDVQEDLAGCA
jgi:hypothetical protein